MQAYFGQIITGRVTFLVKPEVFDPFIVCHMSRYSTIWHTVLPGGIPLWDKLCASNTFTIFCGIGPLAPILGKHQTQSMCTVHFLGGQDRVVVKVSTS